MHFFHTYTLLKDKETDGPSDTMSSEQVRQSHSIYCYIPHLNGVGILSYYY